jgi:hypothetical protein
MLAVGPREQVSAVAGKRTTAKGCVRGDSPQLQPAPPDLMLRGNRRHSERMHRRIRFLAALLALFAFSAFLAEEVWATMCPPDSVQVEMELGEATHHGSHHHGGGEADPDGTESTDCPLMAISGAGCVSVTLPAIQLGSPSPVAGSLTLRPVDLDRLHDLVVIHGLFRPPIA